MEGESRFTKEDLETRDAIWVVIRDKEWRILVQDHVKLDFWTIPIGKVKAGEDLEEVMKQELQEELGIRVNDYKKIWICEGGYDYSGIKIRIKTHIFDILDYVGEVQNLEPEKHRSIEFMSLEQIAGLPRISNATRYLLGL